MAETQTPRAPQPEYQKRGRSKRPLAIGVAVLAVAAVAAAVVFATTRGGAGGGPAANELTIGLVLEPTSLNVRTTPGVALDQVLIDNVYQGLVGLESGTLDVVPVLAETVAVSDDGLRYAFGLRSGVTFHSGNPLTAADVVDSLTETLGAGEDAPEITAAGDTVTLTLPAPNSALLRTLAGREGLILESAATNDPNNSANGTGPYELSRWKQGDSITLSKRAEYWGEPATLDTVVYRYIPDGKAAVNAAISGDVDVQTAVLPELVGEFAGRDEFTLTRAASSDVFTLAFNNQRAPLDDPRVRVALTQAIDQAAIIAAINGEGLPLGGPITELEPGYRDLTDVHPHDPAAAKALLAEAGQEQLSLTMTVPNFYGPTATDLLVTQFAAVGVTLNVAPVEFATWLEDVYTNRDFQLSFVDHAEAGDFGNYANPNYYFGYDSEAVQRHAAAATAATDPAVVDRELAAAAAIVAADAPAAWLYNYTPSSAIRAGVEGFPTANTNSRINLAGISVEG